MSKIEASIPSTELKSRAWSLPDGPQIVSNVVGNVYESHQSARRLHATLILPECGSAYHEWEVVRALKAAGALVTTVVLMDGHIEQPWRDAWQRLARLHDTRLVVLESYVALGQWTTALGETIESDVSVVYINGTIRFSHMYCGQVDPDECRGSAVRFGEWYERNVKNRPLNFVGGSVLRPALSCKWGELAAAFTERPRP